MLDLEKLEIRHLFNVKIILLQLFGNKSSNKEFERQREKLRLCQFAIDTKTFLEILLITRI